MPKWPKRSQRWRSARWQKRAERNAQHERLCPSVMLPVDVFVCGCAECTRSAVFISGRLRNLPHQIVLPNRYKQISLAASAAQRIGAESYYSPRPLVTGFVIKRPGMSGYSGFRSTQSKTEARKTPLENFTLTTIFV
jgi:hypothetical protein